MCRLYGLRSTHRTRVGCELIEAQNALIQQSRKDARGLSNPHGWGIGYYRHGRVTCKRQASPASQSESFRSHATQIRAPTVVAHVRRATVGDPKLVNTHPFLDNDANAMLAHNGHVDHFERVRERALEEMDDDDRSAIEGTTDSEHWFRLLQSRRRRHPETPMHEIVRETVVDIRRWTRDIDDDAEVALNLLWFEGDRMAGARYGRSLFYVERTEPHLCEVCGSYHAHPDDDEPYHAVELASEKITDEDWDEVPENHVFEVGPERDLVLTPVD